MVDPGNSALLTWIGVEARVVKKRRWLQGLEIVSNVLWAFSIVTAVIGSTALLNTLLKVQLGAKCAPRGPDAVPAALTRFTHKIRVHVQVAPWGAAAGLCRKTKEQRMKPYGTFSRWAADDDGSPNQLVEGS
jgi:hypothetical protein